MNAAVFVGGFTQGGAVGARRALETFWRRVADAAVFSPFRRSPLDVLLGRWTLDHSPMFLALDMIARVVSPYDLSPTPVNPLRRSSQTVSTSTSCVPRASSFSSPRRACAPGRGACSAMPI
jgi:hypothetical protein